MWYYNQKNAKEILSSIKRVKNIIVIQFSIMIIIGGWFCFSSIFGNKFHEYSDFAFYTSLTVVIVLLSILVYLLCMLFTRKVRSDIKFNRTSVKEVIAENVQIKNDVEPGSGVLYIPILGNIFPQFFGQKMKSVAVSYLVLDSGERYYIPLDLKCDSKDKINLYFGEQSGVYLGCTVV